MTKRELFKQLKEEKLFSVYCIVIANSFWTENTARGYKDTVSTWPLNKYCKFEIKIQQ